MQISRRAVLRSAVVLGALPLAPRGASTTVIGETSNALPTDLIDQSIEEIAHRIRQRTVSSHEVVAAFLSRIDQVNGRLNAVVQIRREEALRDARARDQELARGEYRGPLHGIPFTVKDSFDTAGLISSAGTQGRAEYVPPNDATVVARLRDAGAILLGKTNTPELTLLYSTVNRVYGTTHNPYDLSRTPGGSSGGAAAILAASGSPLDIGSDTAGSIRIPAHFCGITGIMPTAGRVPRTGHILSYGGPLEELTHVGPMARFVRDLRIVLPIISGVDGIDPHIAPVPLRASAVDLKRLRVAFFSNNGRSAPSPDTKATIESTASTVMPHVASMKGVFPLVLDEAFRLYGQLVTADGYDWVKRILDEAGTESSSLGMLRKAPPAKSAPEFTQLVEQWDSVRSRAIKFWRLYDALICPITAAPAHKTGTAAPKHGFSYSAAINTLGWPAVAVRAGTSTEGLPIGVQVVAPMWREDIALAVAELIEQELGGWQPIGLS